jgi:hypothetical protein
MPESEEDQVGFSSGGRASAKPTITQENRTESLADAINRNTRALNQNTATLRTVIRALRTRTTPSDDAA